MRGWLGEQPVGSLVEVNGGGSLPATRALPGTQIPCTRSGQLSTPSAWSLARLPSELEMGGKVFPCPCPSKLLWKERACSTELCREPARLKSVLCPAGQAPGKPCSCPEGKLRKSQLWSNARTQHPRLLSSLPLLLVTDAVLDGVLANILLPPGGAIMWDFIKEYFSQSISSKIKAVLVTLQGSGEGAGEVGREGRRRAWQWMEQVGDGR